MSPPHPVVLLVPRRQLVPVSPGASPSERSGLPLATVLIDGRCWATMSTVAGSGNRPSGMTLHQAKGDNPQLGDQIRQSTFEKTDGDPRPTRVRGPATRLPIARTGGRGGSPSGQIPPPLRQTGRLHRHEAPRFGGPEVVGALGGKAAAEHRQPRGAQELSSHQPCESWSTGSSWTPSRFFGNWGWLSFLDRGCCRGPWPAR